MITRKLRFDSVTIRIQCAGRKGNLANNCGELFSSEYSFCMFLCVCEKVSYAAAKVTPYQKRERERERERAIER